MSATVAEPLRDVIGRAIYEEKERDDWYSLSEARREPWREDADRVLAAIKTFGADRFEAFAIEIGGVDWLALSADDLWREFFDSIIDGANP